MEEVINIMELVDGEMITRPATTDELAMMQAVSGVKIVPAMVTMRQARLALLQAGKLADVATAIASLPSPTKEAAQIEWEFSSVVERNRSMTQMIAQALSMTEAELDDLFILAATL